MQYRETKELEEVLSSGEEDFSRAFGGFDNTDTTADTSSGGDGDDDAFNDDDTLYH